MKTLFVYGTLKRGLSNHHFLAGQSYIGDARTAPGYALYELSGYPGMVPEPWNPDGVTGEVWSVDDACLAHLDELEGTEQGLYRRELVPLVAPFADVPVEAYLYSESLVGRRLVGSTWTE
jgi:gamma-glutamylaminecyclotransferase